MLKDYENKMMDVPENKGAGSCPACGKKQWRKVRQSGGKIRYVCQVCGHVRGT